ncbi:MAG: NfeD family protein [Treponema sp.]
MFDLSITAFFPWFWFILAVVFVIIELITFGLTTIWAAISAICLIFISLMPVPFTVQAILFALLTLVLILFTRPFVQKKLQSGQEKTNTAALIGKHIMLQKEITPYEKGEAKINGLVWSVRSIHDVPIACGTECIIEKIEGVTLVVKIKE